MLSKHNVSRMLILAGIALLVPASVSADLIASLEPSTMTFTVGDSGSFDVFVTGTSATPDSVVSYVITVNATNTEPGGPAGVSFNNATTATAAPDGYIFPSNQALIDSTTSSEAKYTDVASGRPPTPTEISIDESYGAGRIFFDAVAPGTYEINFDPVQSAFFGPDTFPVTTRYTPTTITVLPAAVPEPTTTLLLFLTGVGGLFVARLRRRRSPEPVAG